MERPVRLELTYANWQSAVLAAGRRTLERAAGIGPATGGLEDHDSTTELRPLTTKMVEVVRLELTYPCSQGRWDSRFPTPRKLKSPESFWDRGQNFAVLQSGSGTHIVTRGCIDRLRPFWFGPELDCSYH